MITVNENTTIYFVIEIFDGIINNVHPCNSLEETKNAFEKAVNNECTYEQYLAEESDEILSSGHHDGTQVWEFTIKEMLKKRE